MLDRLLVWMFGFRKPGKVQQFNAEVDEMANVRLTWVLPNVSTRQRPLAHTTIDARVSADLPWTPIANVPANSADTPTTEAVLEDVAPGTWFYRARAFDDQGTDGNPAHAQVSVGFDRPGTISEFVATLE